MIDNKCIIDDKQLTLKSNEHINVSFNIKNAEEFPPLPEVTLELSLSFSFALLDTDVATTTGTIECRERLGGLLRYYHRAAA